MIRKVKDAQDISTNELIYFKGHALATYMSDGNTVEQAIKTLQDSGGGGSVNPEDLAYLATKEELNQLSETLDSAIANKADVIYVDRAISTAILMAITNTLNTDV